MIGKIARVPLREVWRHEAYDFTQWLQDNIDVLSDVIDLNLNNAEREQNAGTFSIDIVAEDDSGDPVIIENQLEKSDHDHLGKLITYLVAIGAKAAIWIVSDPRPEHINAINWLNETSTGNFYLLKVEAVKIGDSPPAPLLTIIVQPSSESRNLGKTKKEWKERDILREQFWTQFLDYAKTKTKLHINISPTHHNWLGTSAGVRGIGYNYGIRKDSAQVELYIDKGESSEELNKNIFNQLRQNKPQIEDTFGEPLEWLELEGKRACRIKKDINVGGYRNDDKWENLNIELCNAMIRLEKAFKPFIKKLNIS